MPKLLANYADFAYSEDMTTKHTLSTSQISGLEILKGKDLVWETDNPTVVNRKTLDSLVKKGLASVEVEGFYRSGQRSGQYGWIKGGRHSIRTYSAK